MKAMAAVRERAVPGRAVPGRALPGRALPGRAVPRRAVPGQDRLYRDGTSFLCFEFILCFEFLTSDEDSVFVDSSPVFEMDLLLEVE